MSQKLRSRRLKQRAQPPNLRRSLIYVSVKVALLEMGARAEWNRMIDAQKLSA